MIHIITDHQIAYVCETDQMVGFHIVLTLIKYLLILVHFNLAILRKIDKFPKLKCRQNFM